MISQELKQYLNENIEAITKTEVSRYAISVISGSIEINQGTHISRQSFLMSCFLSNVKISGVTLSSIEFLRVYILATSSNLTLENT